MNEENEAVLVKLAAIQRGVEALQETQEKFGKVQEKFGEDLQLSRMDRALINRTVNDLVAKVNEQDEILCGNGTPGLNEKVRAIEAKLNRVDEISIALFGKDGKGGLVAIVDKIVSNNSIMSRVVWIVVSAILGSAVGAGTVATVAKLVATP